MRSFPSLATVVLVAALHPSLAGKIQGVATDRSGNPLHGVVVKRLSTGDSTTSAADGSWYLAWTTGATRRAASGIGPRGLLSLQDGRLALSADGFRIDGRRGLLGGSTTIPDMRFAPRAAEASADTIAMRWKGASSKTPLHADAPTEDLGRMVLDTSGLARFEIRASRHETMGLSCLRLDVVSIDSSRCDSTTLRLHLSGTGAEMADFAVRIDIAQFHDAAGFSKQVSLDADRWRETVPVPVDPSCPATSTCSWSIDLPLDGATIGTDERLRASLLFDRHILSGDSLRYSQSRPTHDPFSGSDWSFRARTWSDSTVAPPGMPDYGGVPIALATDLPEAAPYIVLLRKRRLISGKAPSNKS